MTRFGDSARKDRTNDFPVDFMNARKLDDLLKTASRLEAAASRPDAEAFSLAVMRRILEGGDPGRADLMGRLRIWWPAGVAAAALTAWALVAALPHGPHPDGTPVSKDGRSRPAAVGFSKPVFWQEDSPL